MKIAVLHAGRAPHALIPEYGDYDDMSKALLGLTSHEADTFTVLDNSFPNSPDDYDLYIITGSPCGVYDQQSWISSLEGFIRRAFQSHIKMIGLCFGHQIIAQALGGTVVKSDKGYGIGVLDYDIRPPFAKDQNISLCAWHQDQVIVAPPQSDIVLTSDFCPIAGLIYGSKVISFQPHPEFSRAFVKDMINVRCGDTITVEMAKAAETTLSKVTDTPLIQKLIQSALNLEFKGAKRVDVHQ